MPPTGTLRLYFQRDSDGTGELFVEATSDGFAGRASAWFSDGQLLRFAQALDAFPLRDPFPTLHGGFWSSTPGVPTIEQEHVGLEVRPLGRRGTVAVTARLAAPESPGEGTVLPKRLALTFVADYAELQRFAEAVAALAQGRSDQAALVSEVTYA